MVLTLYNDQSFIHPLLHSVLKGFQVKSNPAIYRVALYLNVAAGLTNCLRIGKTYIVIASEAKQSLY